MIFVEEILYVTKADENQAVIARYDENCFGSNPHPLVARNAIYKCGIAQTIEMNTTIVTLPARPISVLLHALLLSLEWRCDDFLPWSRIFFTESAIVSNAGNGCPGIHTRHKKLPKACKAIKGDFKLKSIV